MAFVQKAVARLDEKEKLDKLLEELGKNHFYYGAPKKYIEVSFKFFYFLSTTHAAALLSHHLILPFLSFT